MKKGTAVLLAFLLLFSCFAGAYAADDVTYFDTTLLAIFDKSCSEWMESAFNRAQFAVCALLDYSLQDDATYGISGLYTGEVYVGRASTTMLTGFHDPDRNESLVIMMDARNNKKAAYNIYSFNKSMLQTAMKTVCTDGYELVDSDDLEMVVEIIQAALNDSK